MQPYPIIIGQITFTRCLLSNGQRVVSTFFFYYRPSNIRKNFLTAIVIWSLTKKIFSSLSVILLSSLSQKGILSTKKLISAYFERVLVFNLHNHAVKNCSLVSPAGHTREKILNATTSTNFTAH